MSKLANVQTKAPLKPPRLVVHGRGGVGKTSLFASMRKPILIPAEEGLGDLSIPHFERPNEFSDVMEMIEELRKEDHDYGTLGIDTIDHIEPLVWAKVCLDRTEGKKVYDHIEDFGFGKGYAYADPVWTDFFQGLDALRRERNMMICVLCHNEVKTVDDPNIGPYDRVAPKLHKRANALMYEWADIVGYMDIERTATEIEGARGQKFKTSAATGQRILYLEDRGGFVAKNRYRLPGQVEVPIENPYSVLRAELAKRLSSPKESA